MEVIMTQSIETTGINALCASLTPDLSTDGGQITTTSLQVAEHFGKRHADVLRAIKDLLKELPKVYQRNFALIQIEVDLGRGRTRKDRAYRMTRDGFALLAMGFTGKEALQWKLAYITAFNTMEAQLLARQQADAQQIKEQLYANAQASLQLAEDFKAKYDGMTLDYIKLQRQLIGSQGAQIGLIKRWNAREANLTILQMTRDGHSNAQIVAATGRTYNHVRQAQFQAREKGILPPLLTVVSPQTNLFTDPA